MSGRRCVNRLRHDGNIVLPSPHRSGTSASDELESARLDPVVAPDGEDLPGILFPSDRSRTRPQPLTMNAISLMLTRRYHAGGGTLRCFGSHRIRHATATLLVNNGMPLEEVSRYLGHSSTMPTRRYAQQTPGALGARAAEALARAGLTGA